MAERNDSTLAYFTKVWDQNLGTFVDADVEVRRIGRFVKGPIPLHWIETAARLPGQALQVSMAIWYRAGLMRADTVKLSNEVVKSFGVTRQSKSRALDALEQAKLVRVERRLGASPQVTILR